MLFEEGDPTHYGWYHAQTDKVPGCRRKLFKHEPMSKPTSCVPWPKQLWQGWQMPTYVSWERRIVLFSLVAFAAVFQLDTR